MNTRTPLRAFHGKQEIKDSLIAQLEAHRAADEITQGTYWNNGRGCAVGCCIHTSANPHKKMATMFGIEEPISYLIDGIFEGLPLADAKDFPLAVIHAIPVGADLSKIDRQMCVFSLNQCRPYAFDDGKSSIDTVLVLLARSLSDDEPSNSEWSDAATATTADAATAATAARYATEAARYAVYAARYATEAARYAVYAARYATEAADAAYAVRSAADAARSAAYAVWIAQRDEFLRLLKGKSN